jgi:hypothetical protein
MVLGPGTRFKLRLSARSGPHSKRFVGQGGSAGLAKARRLCGHDSPVNIVDERLEDGDS